jgi:hypothetical protein
MHHLRSVRQRHFAKAATWRASQGSIRALRPRQKLGHALESHPAHLSVLILISLDVLAVVAEVMLAHVAARPDPTDEAGIHRVHTWESALGWISFGILILLLAQQLLLLVAFGLAYFTKLWYVLDLIVLVVAIVLEIALGDVEGGLLALALSWRIVRIVHGLLATAETEAHDYGEVEKQLVRASDKLKRESDYSHTVARFYAYRWLIHFRHTHPQYGAEHHAGHSSPHSPGNAASAASVSQATAAETKVREAADATPTAAAAASPSPRSCNVSSPVAAEPSVASHVRIPTDDAALSPRVHDQ